MLSLLLGGLYLKKQSDIHNRLTGNYPVKDSSSVFFVTNGDLKKNLDGYMLSFKIRDKVLFALVGGIDLSLILGFIYFYY